MPNQPDPTAHDKSFADAAAEARARHEAEKAKLAEAMNPEPFRHIAAGVGAYRRGLKAEGVPKAWAAPLVEGFRAFGLEHTMWFAPETAEQMGRVVGAYVLGLGEEDDEARGDEALHFQRWALEQAREGFLKKQAEEKAQAEGTG